MLVEFELLDGTKASVKSVLVTRMRPSHGPQEAPGATMIEYAPNRVFSRESVDALAARFDEHLRVARFDTPIGTTVVVNVDHVAAVTPAVPAQHHAAAKAVLRFTTKVSDQQVTQTTDEVIAALKGA